MEVLVQSEMVCYLPVGSTSCNCPTLLEEYLGLYIKSQSKTLLREGLECAVMKLLEGFPPVSHWMADGLG